MISTREACGIDMLPDPGHSPPQSTDFSVKEGTHEGNIRFISLIVRRRHVYGLLFTGRHSTSPARLLTVVCAAEFGECR
jgi:hypothetical protein